MAKLLVFTDLHITQPGRLIIGLDPAARFAACLDHALARHPDADRIIVTGDLTHGGLPGEYARLADVLRRLPDAMPLSLMLGNHDNRAAFRAAFPDQPVTAGGFVQSAVDAGAVRAVLLDTLDGQPQGPGHHAGLLCADRLAWLDNAMRGAGPLLVCAHHPPMAVGFPAMDPIRLANGTALLDRLAAHPAPVHLICGHIHRTISGAARGVPFSVLKSPCHQMPMDLVDEDCTLSIDEPGGYGVVLTLAEGISVLPEDVGLPDRPVLSGYGNG